MQAKFFDGAPVGHERATNAPEGLRYRSALVERSVEDALIAHVRELPFREFEFHGYASKRRVVQRVSGLSTLINPTMSGAILEKSVLRSQIGMSKRVHLVF